MEKMARAKKVFYSTLKRNGISPEDYIASNAGMSILKRAAELGLNEKCAAGAMGLIEALVHKGPPQRLALGIGGGYTAGKGLGMATSPSSAAIGNLQKREQIAEYDAAIQELKNRMEAKAI